jgi:hypothetical protein
VLEKVLAAIVPIWVQGPAELVARSTLNPDSFVELSVHERLIWLEEAAEAARLLGATGADEADEKVLALATLE